MVPLRWRRIFSGVRRWLHLTASGERIRAAGGERMRAVGLRVNAALFFCVVAVGHGVVWVHDSFLLRDPYDDMGLLFAS